MSSEEKDISNTSIFSATVAPAKKRKYALKACDRCKKNKTRCSYTQNTSGNHSRTIEKTCNMCASNGLECIFTPILSKPKKHTKGYVDGLENTVKLLERKVEALEKLPQDSNLFSEPDIPESGPASGSGDVSGHYIGLMPEPNVLPSEEDDTQAAELMTSLQSLDIQSPSVTGPLFGASSGATLAANAYNIKINTTEQSGSTMARSEENRKQDWTQLWEDPVQTAAPHRPFIFPETSLMNTLIDLYFGNSGVLFPVVHKPSFLRGIEENLHSQNEAFGATVLLVCAIAATDSDDPHIYGPNSLVENGGVWFNQTKSVGLAGALQRSSSLYHLQCYCLTAAYLGNTAPATSWLYTGVGIRNAQDVGIHRRKPTGHKLTIEDEMCKRVFWALVCKDRLLRAGLGRPCTTRGEDFDLDLPVSCNDDELETYLATGCKTSTGPSVTEYFICLIKLLSIQAFALSTIYSINKPVYIGRFYGKDWLRHVTAEIDSALNHWKENVPPHLQWSADGDLGIFHQQSLSINCLFHKLQILIHRRFMKIGKSTPPDLSSLMMCTNAARSLTSILDSYFVKTGKVKPWFMFCAFHSGIVLVVKAWRAKKADPLANTTRETADVQKCVRILQVCNEGSRFAGCLLRALLKLASYGTDDERIVPPPHVPDIPPTSWDVSGAINAYPHAQDTSTFAHDEQLPEIGQYPGNAQFNLALNFLFPPVDASMDYEALSQEISRMSQSNLSGEDSHMFYEDLNFGEFHQLYGSQNHGSEDAARNLIPWNASSEPAFVASDWAPYLC